MTLMPNPNEPFEFPFSLPSRPSLPTLPRRCEFKRRVLENNRVWKILDWEPGILHTWSIDHEEFETGPGMYPVGIVEDSTGCIHSVYAEHVRMVP
jgi:hypothetical protein